MANLSVNRDISYINRDFTQFREQLINYSQTYFPNTYNDFSDTSPGMMFMEQAAYVGDVLGFYIDNQVQENFIQYSRQTKNLYELAYMYSYKPKVTGLANTDITLYQLLPAVASGSAYVPDWNYALLFPTNLSITSVDNLSQTFVTQDVVDMTYSSSISPTNVTVAQISGTDPTYYLISKKVKAVSGAIQTTTFTFGDYVAFPTVTINDSNIANIVDVFDSNDNEYYDTNNVESKLFSDILNTVNPLQNTQLKLIDLVSKVKLSLNIASSDKTYGLMGLKWFSADISKFIISKWTLITATAARILYMLLLKLLAIKKDFFKFLDFIVILK